MIPKSAANSPKPRWPYAHEAKLFAAANGQWAKKIQGKRHYFGPWADPAKALARYRAESPALFAGLGKRDKTDDPTVKELCAFFIVSKAEQLKAGELTGRTYDDYVRVCQAMMDTFGKDTLVSTLTAASFSTLRGKLGPSKVRRANQITWARTVFNWGYESDLIKTPVKFGPDFKRPKAGDIRRHKTTRGRRRLYSPEEISAIIAAASPLLKACTYLGINAGFGNTDCSALELADVDLKAGVIDTTRNKTGFPRTATLWPETVTAIQEWLKVRPKPPKDLGHLLFITPYGSPLVQIKTGKNQNPLPDEEERLQVVKVDYFANVFGKKLLKTVGIKGKGFYDLRHTFRTIAELGEFKERTIDRIMGHVQEGIGTEYIHDFSLEKIRAVTNHVRNWFIQKSSAPHTGGAAGVAAQSSALPGEPAGTHPDQTQEPGTAA